MTPQPLRLRRLEDHARQTVAAREARQGAQVQAALTRLDLGALEALHAALGQGRGRPLVDLSSLPGEVGQWVQVMACCSARDVWPLPPTDAPDTLTAQAAQAEDDTARAWWALLAALALVMLGDDLT